MWTNQNNRENTRNCATSRRLYDKFEGFVADLIKLVKKLTKAKQNTAAMNKLVEGRKPDCKC
jgi:DNA recombination protein RmuC